MALTGLQIQKLLPATNCKECGSNTCLAFAMKLAAKKAEISACPYASDEAKQTLGLANEPPVKSITLGPLTAGGETVLYRHDKTFVNKTILAININDTDKRSPLSPTPLSPDGERGVGDRGDPLPLIHDYALERVGETLVVDMVAITQLDSDPAAFIALAAEVRQVTGKPLILRSPNQQALAATAAPGDILCATVANLDGILPLARERGCALSLSAPDLDALVAASGKLREDGFTNLLLQFETHTLAEQLQTNTIARHAAIKDSFKPLGFPFLRFIDTGNPMDDTAAAVTEIAKYGSVCVLPSFNPAQLATLLTLRQNIYTDPQKPIQVEPRLYPIGEPNPDAPIFVTTNFSLTFFIVSGEIENSGISAWLVVPECEGMSVLTAWAAGKFSAATIAKFIKETNLEEQIRSRRIVIPGYVASISGELEDNLPGWQILVGPEEASDLEGFIKTYLT